MKNVWTKGNQKFWSSYDRTKKDRVFTLINPKSSKTISFESWQAVKKMGYIKS
jgi:hypothetical protein